MIESTIAMVAMAGLFVLFGALRPPDRSERCGGSCHGCETDCEQAVASIQRTPPTRGGGP